MDIFDIILIALLILFIAVISVLYWHSADVICRGDFWCTVGMFLSMGK